MDLEIPYESRWRKVSEGYELLDHRSDNVSFVHERAFPGGAIEVSLVDETKAMHVFHRLNEGEIDGIERPSGTDENSDPDLVGTIRYIRPHRYPLSAWQGDRKLTQWLGGYYRRPRYRGQSVDPNDLGAAGFMVRNFWPLKAHENPLGHAVYRLVMARMWFTLADR